MLEKSMTRHVKTRRNQITPPRFGLWVTIKKKFCELSLLGRILFGSVSFWLCLFFVALFMYAITGNVFYLQTVLWFVPDSCVVLNC